MLLIVTKISLIYITILISKASFSFQLIILKFTLVSKWRPSFCNSKLSKSLFFSINKLSIINISIAISQYSFSMKFTIFKGSLISFIFIYIFSHSCFMIIMKFPLINSSIRLIQYTFSLFFPHIEPSFVERVILKIFQLPKAMKLILLKLSLVFSNSFQKIFSLSIFFTIFESTLIFNSTFRLICPIFELVFQKLSFESVPICKQKLAISTMLFASNHCPFET